jgi:hypothetical protein
MHETPPNEITNFPDSTTELGGITQLEAHLKDIQVASDLILHISKSLENHRFSRLVVFAIFALSQNF